MSGHPKCMIASKSGLQAVDHSVLKKLSRRGMVLSLPRFSLQKVVLGRHFRLEIGMQSMQGSGRVSEMINWKDGRCGMEWKALYLGDFFQHIGTNPQGLAPAGLEKP